MRESAPELSALPPRLPLPSLLQFALYLGCVLLLALSIDGIGVSIGDLVAGIPSMGRIL
jgi:hypothetical protein